ncbi:MAG: class I SAM-dependent methyltransferase [candidate division KSB1 bacterium]|nr:class I SAM-dependent methyltransferase [candidate division KSB1 bacterium]MDZ7393505.1 class I SAM-dependent methyltransferase [candidate division KSB1 bacterium]
MATGAVEKRSRRAHWEQFWAERGEATAYYSNADRVVEQIARAVSLRGIRALEVGAGTGRDGLRLAQRGARVILLDYAQQAAEMMKRQARVTRGVHVVRADACAMPIRDKTLDVVFHQGLLEHFADPKPLLRENVRVVRPGGIVVVDVPQRYHIYTVLKHILMALGKWFAGWETEFSVRQLKRLMERSGLEVLWVYGDYMRPSLFYRMLRELFRRVGIRLPMYPPMCKPVQSLRARVRRAVLRRPLWLNTCMDIGVVARRPEGR